MEFLSVDYFVTDVDKSLIACFISVDFKKPSAMNKPSEDNHTQSFMDLLNFSSVTYFVLLHVHQNHYVKQQRLYQSLYLLVMSVGASSGIRR